MIDWSHQPKLIEATRQKFTEGHKSVLLQLATGGGKTRIFTEITKRAIEKGNEVWILVHRRELLTQAADALMNLGVMPSYIAPNIKIGDNPVKVASVGTLISRLKKGLINDIRKPDLIIPDEGHHSVASQWKYIFSAYPNARILGVSATPSRTDGTGLKDVFQTMVCGDQYGASTKELIQKGVLSPYQIFSQPLTLDLLNVRIASNGDYNKDELAEALKSVIGCEVAEYKKHLHGKPSIAFYPTVETAQIGAEKFRLAGYRAVSIDGSMKPAERKKAIADLGNGNLDVLTSCDVISEGTDIPIVVGALLLTKTKSIIKYLQQVGRVLRSAKGKTHAIILDFVGNVGIHGLPCEDREWSLDGVKRKKRTKEITERITQCDNCSHHFLTKNRVCDRCGWELDASEKRKTIIEDGELISVSIEYFEKVQLQLKFEKKRQDSQAQTMEELIALGVSRGYSNPHGWALHKLKARSNKW
jgi:superfamily II DNA or RNA helicase